MTIGEIGGVLFLVSIGLAVIVMLAAYVAGLIR